MIESSTNAIEDKWDHEENLEAKDKYQVNQSSKPSLESEKNLKASSLARRLDNSSSIAK